MVSIERKALCNDLNHWVHEGATDLETRERTAVAAEIISCFHHRSPVLSINAAHITELPRSISFLRHLSGLNLSGCESLISIPDVLNCIDSLELLDVTGCRSLAVLPRSAIDVRGCGRVILKGSGVNLADPMGSLRRVRV